MASKYVIEVSDTDFEYEVIAHSKNVPVVVDFWAEWCGPCRMLGPLLERLAEEAGGDFRLAKVDVDQNQTLAMRYNVRGIPAVKAFRDGQVVAEFTGALPEPQVREFLRQIAPSENDLLIEKGRSYLGMYDWPAAEEAFEELVDKEPENPTGLLGLAKSRLAQGKGAEALELLTDFPTSREFSGAETLRPLAKVLVQVQRGEMEAENPLDAAFHHTLRLIVLDNIPAAMDGLLDVLRLDKHYREDLARLVMLALFELLGESSELTRAYRSELASVIF